MAVFENALPLTNRQPVTFKCTACGTCCKNVRDSIVLEPFDAYRIIRKYIIDGSTEAPDDILWRIADLKELSKGFSVFVLKCVDDSGVCGMLENNRCSIYSARPRTCRQYPFAAEPCEQERRIKWYLCTEQSHHFSGGTVTARHWQRKNMPADEEEYLYAECKTLPELGRLLEKMPDNQLTKVEQLIVAFRYLAYDFSQPFLPQYKDNMMVLRAQLNDLCPRP